MPERPKYILYGIGMSIGALLGAWFLNSVFERSWGAIAMILLAMLIVILVQRMIIGAIPKEPVPPKQPESGSRRPDLWTETAHLPGVDHRYGWMAIPPVAAFVLVLISLIT
jgi:uncharacterized membrane protein YfcA